jgi:hypothetical protein
MEELDGTTASALWRALAEVKQRWSIIGWVTKNLLFAPPCFGRHVRWSRLHFQSLAPTNPHWARVVGYGPFSLCVIHNPPRGPSVDWWVLTTTNSAGTNDFTCFPKYRGARDR